MHMLLESFPQGTRGNNFVGKHPLFHGKCTLGRRAPARMIFLEVNDAYLIVRREEDLLPAQSGITFPSILQ